jgi:uncharacterized OsmC-like protein
MSGLREYLTQKRQALQVRKEQAASQEAQPHILKAKVSAEGRSGIRRMRIRDFQIISDSGPELAGYNLGPSSPELQLGVLGSCITHIFLIQAAQHNVPLDSLEVEVSGQMDPHSGQPGFEHIPIYPHNISYTVHIDSPASSAKLSELHQAVEKSCPILNLLINPQVIHGTIVHNTTANISA